MKRKSKRRRIYRDRYRCVMLRFAGKYLDPDEITEQLGIEPYFAGRRGKIKGKSGETYNRQSGYWSMSSRLRRNATLQNHVKDILEQIRPKKKVLLGILREYSGDLNIAVQPHEELANVGYTFPASLLVEFVSLGFDIRFSIYPSWD
ncbi:MAG: hypothetical protein DRP65_11430 [Planctomycetota bacterium]|nr:MAG: hypothetical protein DRP65_11430 [Planctomycetota bacterium]